MTQRNFSEFGNRESNFQSDARFSQFQMDIQLDMLKYKVIFNQFVKQKNHLIFGKIGISVL